MDINVTATQERHFPTLNSICSLATILNQIGNLVQLLLIPPPPPTNGAQGSNKKTHWRFLVTFRPHLFVLPCLSMSPEGLHRPFHYHTSWGSASHCTGRGSGTEGGQLDRCWGAGCQIRRDHLHMVCVWVLWLMPKTDPAKRLHVRSSSIP